MTDSERLTHLEDGIREIKRFIGINGTSEMSIVGWLTKLDKNQQQILKTQTVNTIRLGIIWTVAAIAVSVTVTAIANLIF
jgi:hypothetical protein